MSDDTREKAREAAQRWAREIAPLVRIQNSAFRHLQVQADIGVPDTAFAKRATALSVDALLSQLVLGMIVRARGAFAAVHGAPAVDLLMEELRAVGVTHPAYDLSGARTH